MTHRSYREESRKNYGRTNLADGVGMDDSGLRLGAILRIADATEKMAQRHTELIAERDRFYHYWLEAQESSARQSKRISALKGQITKLKKKDQKNG